MKCPICGSKDIKNLTKDRTICNNGHVVNISCTDCICWNQGRGCRSNKYDPTSYPSQPYCGGKGFIEK